ncbi:MAG: hypothetical protein R2799_09710 [Crocinitomicaceae bacterium]
MPKKIYYLTFDDIPDAIYKSQVIDVVNLYKKNGVDCTLVTIFSAKGFKKNKAWVKQYVPDAKVYPSVPKLKNWKKNTLYLKMARIKKGSILICRGIMPTNLALMAFDRSQYTIVYDGRGAILAENEEYHVYAGAGIDDQVEEIERKAILETDFRISVTNELIKHWREKYHYQKNDHIVIPCSLNADFEEVQALPEIEGLSKENILIAYAGSLGGWQSLSYLKSFLMSLLNDDRVKIMFLAKENEIVKELQNQYPGRVYRYFVPVNEVSSYLTQADYGLLIREKSVTNKVASPVKFAEYLASGLKVLISPELGDFSGLSVTHDLGIVVSPENKSIKLEKVSSEEKQRLIQFGKEHFLKSSPAIKDSYLKLADL